MITKKIGDIAIEKNTVTISKEAKTKVLVNIFNLSKVQSIVILDGKKAIGLVMKDKLFYRLGSRFGFNLFMDKQVTKIFDSHPLAVDYNTSIIKVARLAMERPKENIYDEIIINKNGNFYSVISIKDLLINVSELRVQVARNANPLTGLPGNRSINNAIKLRIKNEELFSVLYTDLDNFKAYNDIYGYQCGDKMIKLTSKILKESANKYDASAFIGHIGGDDFVIISEVNNDINIAEEIISSFDKKRRKLFNEEDWNRKYMISKNRKKELFKCPLTSISIAIVSNEEIKLNNYLEVGDRAAELKSKVKENEGSNYLKDRRMKNQFHAEF